MRDVYFFFYFKSNFRFWCIFASKDFLVGARKRQNALVSWANLTSFKSVRNCTHATTYGFIHVEAFLRFWFVSFLGYVDDAVIFCFVSVFYTFFPVFFWHCCHTFIEKCVRFVNEVKREKSVELIFISLATIFPTCVPNNLLMFFPFSLPPNSIAYIQECSESHFSFEWRL